LGNGLGRPLGAFRDHVKNTGTIEISEDGNVVMPFLILFSSMPRWGCASSLDASGILRLRDP
jgi:hypothetical protein